MSSLELDRERIIQTLCSHYANDKLTTQELEARFTLAYRATKPSELQALLADLPALPPRQLLTATRVSAPLAVAAPPEPMQREKRTLAFMSETKKTGEWIPARRNVVRAIMGSAHLDLREALLSQGEIEFDVLALMGEVKLIVPPGLRVECDGVAIMGEFKELHLAGDDDPSAPLVRIRGMSFMGSVSVTTRMPGESGMAAWRRRRQERGRR